MDNYRPISIMSVLAKVIEKIVFEQTYKYVTDKNILIENQSGFRPHHSTYSAVLNTTEDVLENVDEGLLTGMVMLDLKRLSIALSTRFSSTNFILLAYEALPTSGLSHIHLALSMYI